jgi:YD repeat-containing protein
LLTATVLAKTYPDGGTERYEHDAAGQLIRRIRPDGTAASHSYDSRGRLLSVKWNADRSEPITYTYDVAGRMTSASNTSATVARSYTATGRLATETQTIRLPDLTQPVENRLTYEYSPDGRLAAITYPDASKVQHYHNARGELIEIIDTQPMAGLDANNARYTYTRRADGKITALTHPNGVTTTRDYDEVGRLAKIAHLDPTGKVLESEASTYDQRDCPSLRSRPAKWLRGWRRRYRGKAVPPHPHKSRRQH